MSIQEQQIPKFKRQSAIKIELGIAKSDEGLRLTVKSDKLTKLAVKLVDKYMLESDEGNRISSAFHEVRKALSFTNESYYVDHSGYLTDSSNHEKINKLITTKKIPNMRFLVTENQIAEIIIDDVFGDPEIQEWIRLFSKFVGMMKKLNKGFGLLE